MQIKITSYVPVEEHIRPAVGKTYEVIETETKHGRTTYFIKENGERVGVFDRECEVVSEAAE